MKDAIVIDFHCLLKGIDYTDSTKHFNLDELEKYDIDDKITDFTDKFKTLIYHSKASNEEIRNKLLDFLIDRLVKFECIVDKYPKSDDYNRYYNLEKIKDSIFLLKEIEKG